MAKILGQNLRHLWALFKIKGGEVTTEQLDLGAVQLVTDVSWMAATGAGLSGTERARGLISDRHAHTADGVISSSTLPYVPGSGQAVGGFPNTVPQEYDIWVVGAWISVHGTAAGALGFLRGGIRVVYPTQPVIIEVGASTVTSGRLISFSEEAVIWSTGGAPFPCVDQVFAFEPFLLPRASTIRFSSEESGGPLTFQTSFGVELLIIPTGAKPT